MAPSLQSLVIGLGPRLQSNYGWLPDVTNKIQNVNSMYNFFHELLITSKFDLQNEFIKKNLENPLQ